MFDFASETGEKKVKYKPLFLLIALVIVSVGFYYIVQSNKKETQVVFQTSEPVKDIYVDISGAVNSPGVYKLTSEARLTDVLSNAQGVSSEANFAWVSKNLNLSRRVSDSEKIYVPFQWDSAESIAAILPLVGQDNSVDSSGQSPQEEPSEELAEPGSTGDSDGGDSAGGLINVNTASKERLMDLDGIGEAYAQKIIDNRPYKNDSELISRAKLSENLVKKISAYISF